MLTQLIRKKGHESGKLPFPTKADTLHKAFAPLQNVRLFQRAFPTAHRIPTRRIAEKAFVFAAELRHAFIAHSKSRACGALVLRQHQTLGLIQTQLLVILERAEARHCLEVTMQA